MIERAVELWRRCPNYGIGFPALINGPGQARTVSVEYRLHSRSSSCGTFQGHRIRLFAFAFDDRGRQFHCGSPAMTLAHELGHVFGLADSADETGCRRYIMADVDQGNRYQRSVQDEECQAASQRWLTMTERRLAPRRPAGRAD